MAFTHHPCALGTPLALCRMPRLTSYHIIARLILPRIPSPSSRIRHAPGPVPGDATTDKLHASSRARLLIEFTQEAWVL